MRNPRGTPHLLRSVWPLIAIVLLQAFLAGISMDMLASVRAYVAGESLWSKGLTEAVYSLSLYSETGDEKYYRQYKSRIAVPVGDRIARQALEGSVPDLKAAFDGFLQGRNHPDDIPDLIWLFRNFSDVSYLAKAIASWRDTDPLIDELVGLADAIHLEATKGPVTRERVDALRTQIYQLSERAAPLAIAFSRDMGDGARSIKRLLTIANLFTAALLISIGIWRTRNLLIQRRKFQSELETEKKRAQVTLASIGEAVISTDADGCVEYMNPTAERLVAKPIGEARGMRLSSLFRFADQDDGRDRKSTRLNSSHRR